MSSLEDRTIPIKLQLPTQEQRIQQDGGQKRKVRKLWPLRRHKRVVPAVARGEYVQPLDSLDKDTNSAENDESYPKEPDRENYEENGDYEQEDSIVSVKG